MITRTFAFAPLSANLTAAFLNGALSAAAAATDVAFTDFQRAWSASVTYNPGTVVTYQGTTYISISQNSHIKPPAHTHYWATLGMSGTPLPFRKTQAG
jgi:hypothetical protein